MRHTARPPAALAASTVVGGAISHVVPRGRGGSGAALDEGADRAQGSTAAAARPAVGVR